MTKENLVFRNKNNYFTPKKATKINNIIGSYNFKSNDTELNLPFINEINLSLSMNNLVLKIHRLYYNKDFIKNRMNKCL